jgi:hypothetical protein
MAINKKIHFPKLLISEVGTHTAMRSCAYKYTENIPPSVRTFDLWHYAFGRYVRHWGRSR